MRKALEFGAVQTYANIEDIEDYLQKSASIQSRTSPQELDIELDQTQHPRRGQPSEIDPPKSSPIQPD